MEILTLTASQAELKLMLWETLMQMFTAYAAVFTAAVFLIYLTLLTREAAK